jgi:hypothetical protein
MSRREDTEESYTSWTMEVLTKQGIAKQKQGTGDWAGAHHLLPWGVKYDY